MKKRNPAAKALADRRHRQRVVPDKRRKQREKIAHCMAVVKDMLDANATGEEIVSALDPDWKD